MHKRKSYVILNLDFKVVYLFDIVHDILSVNFDIANDNVINANALNLLKSSLVGDSFIQNPNLAPNMEFERKGARKVTFTVGTELNQKIIKIVLYPQNLLLEVWWLLKEDQETSIKLL